jgi:excisionase family DNA binding protein
MSFVPAGDAAQTLPYDRLAYSPLETARMLGIGRTLLYELIDRGEIKSLRIGARRLISRSAIEKFLTEREGQP